LGETVDHLEHGRSPLKIVGVVGVCDGAVLPFVCSHESKIDFVAQKRDKYIMDNIKVGMTVERYTCPGDLLRVEAVYRTSMYGPLTGNLYTYTYSAPVTRCLVCRSDGVQVLYDADSLRPFVFESPHYFVD
jgi:hypothetical protein